ncbi:MAG TPA: T9SS type A sorting domain-containing protein, partial [Bacteroidales bacterium]|nr:T9SS type A sorting domain-containing protein [Bacteroidales bacterium]
CSDGVELWAEEHYRVVTAIDTVEVYNGELRRRWTLEGDLMGDTWIEGIGSTHWYGLFNPLISDMTLCGDSYTFACMKQEDEVIYLNNPNCDHCFCDLLTVIGEQDQANPHAVNVYPNPMGGNTVIEFNLDQPVSVRVNLSDATGNIVKQLPYSTYSSGKQQIRLNSHDLNAGIYLLQITFDGREGYTVKLVKGR